MFEGHLLFNDLKWPDHIADQSLGEAVNDRTPAKAGNAPRHPSHEVSLKDLHINDLVVWMCLVVLPKLIAKFLNFLISFQAWSKNLSSINQLSFLYRQWFLHRAKSDISKISFLLKCEELLIGHGVGQFSPGDACPCRS